jgi:hypothetical protein
MLNFLENPMNQLMLAQALVPAFLAILFLQSGTDKLLNFKGNLDYFSDHFGNSPFKKFTKILLIKITAMELTTGVLSLVAVVMLLFFDSKLLAFYSNYLAALTLIALFMGQRLAQDYAGAAILAAYFAVVLIGIKLLM